MRTWLVLAVLATLAGAACRQPPTTSGVPPDAPARRAPAGPTGTIRGNVTLRGNTPVSHSEPIVKDQSVCGSSAPMTRLALGRDNAVRHAFVYLEGLPAGFEEDSASPKLVTEMEQKDCAYGPHAMALTAGAGLEIVNHDPILHNVHAKESTADGLHTIFNIAQPIKGQRTKIDAGLDKPGIVSLTCEAGHPWMSAYILVANHRFVATTDDAGSFVMTGVPVGTYPIKMWHEGVRLTRTIPSLQQYEYEAPYELTHDVVVPPGGEAVVNFIFELRKLG